MIKSKCYLPSGMNLLIEEVSSGRVTHPVLNPIEGQIMSFYEDIATFNSYFERKERVYNLKKYQDSTRAN